MVLVVKNLPASAGEIRDAGSTPRLGRSPGGGHGNPLQYSCLENPMDKGAWRAVVHGVTRSQTRLSKHRGSEASFYDGRTGTWVYLDEQRQFLTKEFTFGCQNILQRPLQPCFTTRSNFARRGHLAIPSDVFIVIHRVKGFGIVNKAEIDVLLELSCFFDDTEDVGNLISGSSAFLKTSLNIWKFVVHVLLKPGLENFEHYFTSMWDECNCAVVLAFFGIVFLWDWNENWPFPVLWPLPSFPNLLAYWVQHFHSIIFQDLK